MPHHVVILGGGFGGLYAAKALASDDSIRVTLIDRRNFHLFQPLLYQVATGALSPGEIAAPLRYVMRGRPNVQVLLEEAVDLDAGARRLIFTEGSIEYDSLIVATGARTSYFGNHGWEDAAPSLKTIEDATRIRQRVFLAFEAAEKETDPDKRREWLTFAVVGAGPTGVELAGALAEIARDTLRGDFRSIRPEESRILLLDGSPRVLMAYSEKSSAAAERALIRLGVRPINGVRVTAVDERGVTIHRPSGEDRIAARTVIWAAGVEASPFGRILRDRAGAELDRVGRVRMTSSLHLTHHPEIFVIGDLAAVEQNGDPLPGVAPVAMQQGRYVAKAIRERLRGQTVRPFEYLDKGSLAVIGRGSAVAEIGPLHLDGLIAWLVWLFVHLMYIVVFQSRLMVFLHWGFLYLTFHRGARLITGPVEEGHSPAA